MASQPSPGEGEALAAEVRARSRRLGLDRLTTRYIAGRHVVRLSWPHPHALSVEQSVEFAASAAGAARLMSFLRAYAESRSASTGSPPSGEWSDGRHGRAPRPRQPIPGRRQAS